MAGGVARCEGRPQLSGTLQEVANVHVDGGVEAGRELGDVPEVPEVVVARGRCSTRGSSPRGALKTRSCSGLDLRRALKTGRWCKLDPNTLFSFLTQCTSSKSQCLLYGGFFFYI